MIQFQLATENKFLPQLEIKINIPDHGFGIPIFLIQKREEEN